MTPYGVPHVRAGDFESLGFGVATAYARENFCLLADQVLTVNGERSRHHGPDEAAVVGNQPLTNMASDFFYKAYLDDAQLKAAYAETSEEIHQLLKGYIAGYNEFLAAGPTQRKPTSCDGKPWVRPITERDFLRLLGDKAILASGAAFASRIVSAEPVFKVKVATAATPKQRRVVRPKPLAGDEILARLHPFPEQGAASNAYALGTDVTSNGSGALLANPHWPWAGSNKFFEIHMTVPGRFDVYGVMNGDAPVPLIGFNRDVAWTHTVSPAFRHTFVQLQLTDPLHYVVDGEVRELTPRVVSVDVLGEDGKIGSQQRTFYSSHLGVVVDLKGLVPNLDLSWDDQKAFVLRDANRNSLRTLEQWLRIGQSRSVADVEAALKDVAAIPYVHTTAVDRHGGTLMADIGRVPNVPSSYLKDVGAGGCIKGDAAMALWQQAGVPVLDGSRSVCDWKVEAGAPAPGLMPVARLPAIKRTDYVANSNQSAWFAHPQARIDDLEPILGRSKVPLTLRQRLAFMQIEELVRPGDVHTKQKLDGLAPLRELLYSNRLLAAELSMEGKGTMPLLTDLVSECLPLPGQAQRLVTVGSETVDIAPACRVLQRWDGRADLKSEGAVLFREFWRNLRMPEGTPLWLTAFDLDDAVHTPRDLNTTTGKAGDTLREILARTVLGLSATGVDYWLPLGELQAVTRAGKRIPLHGGDEFEGAFNKLTMNKLTSAGYTDVRTGSSYIQAVTWRDGKVEAEGVLAYSQSSEPASSHLADQTEELFAAKKFKKLAFDEADIQALQVGPTEQVRVPSVR